jgi:hypothetical protein
MALNYEKPVIVPFNNDETGFGVACSPTGSGYIAGACKSGGAATDRCQSGTVAAGVCAPAGGSPYAS